MFSLASTSKAQIAHYNQYPTMYVDGYMDEYAGISFAYSMRRLYNDYVNPIIKLRRASDNATMDFYATDTDLVDVAAITAWAGGSNLYVDTWYDQRNRPGYTLTVRNAVQGTNDNQPRFYVDATIPYFAGDGSNDFLVVQNGRLGDVTTGGKNGSVFTVAKATNYGQYSFGVASDNIYGYNRWLAQLNWSSGRAVFDPGEFSNAVAVGNRSFVNTSNAGLWKQYSFVGGTSTVTIRQNAVSQVTNGATLGLGCSLVDASFYICAASNATGVALLPSTTAFSEMIMFSTTVASTDYENIEQSQMSFWGL